MYTGLKHLHVLLVTLFTLSVLIKAVLVLVNSDKFDSYRKKTKVPEMIVTMLFLVTGIIMASMRGFGFHYFFHIKLTLMVIAIPLAIIGLKKKNKALSLVSAFMFIITIGLAFKSGNNMREKHVDLPATDPNFGKALYEANCATCHGDNGSAQIGGAYDLTTGEYEAFQVAEIINKGVVEDNVIKMNAFKTLDSVEVKAISEYVLTLKAK